MRQLRRKNNYDNGEFLEMIRRNDNNFKKVFIKFDFLWSLFMFNTFFQGLGVLYKIIIFIQHLPFNFKTLKKI